MKKESLVKIGYIMKTHGLKGEVTLKLHPDAPELEPHDVLMVETESGFVPHFVERISFKGSQAFLKLEEISTIEQSKLLKGKSVFFEKASRPKLKRGEYYEDEYVGLSVWEGKLNLGEVIQVVGQGASRFLEIGDKKWLIPINGPFIKSVSKAKKKIEVDLPEGFLEI
jgi:16S rRNA processing protein RimM